LEQELLLGIGGVRALRLYCRLTATPDPSVFHTNEGHAGFLGLERISELVVAGLSLEEALTAVRAGTVFTTHTPVPAGIDRFPAAMVAAHFGPDAELPMLPVERILALGAEPSGDGSAFNMAVMGLRLAQRANGVSALHGQVSRSMFASLWPGFDVADVPIGHVTNGVHGPTWVAPEIVSLVRERIGPELAEESRGWERLGDISDEELWGLKRYLREGLITEARARIAASARVRGAAEAEMGWTAKVLAPDVLTIGFARRVPAYKRLTLMLRDPDRLRALLTDPQRPVQIVVAGKSHPADDGGKAMIQELVRFADDDAVRSRIAFLPDYDIDLAQALFGGCDVWLNNPLRPLEACGTSGMKAALNGALNLSVRDGWWDELYDGRNGWAIPSADGIPDAHRRDEAEADALYELLEESVVPAFYDRDERGLPHRWLSMVRHTLSTVGPQVLAGRMLRDYLDDYYTPAAAGTAAMAADGWAAARELAGWAAWLWECWPEVAVEHVEVDVPADLVAVGQTCPVGAVVRLGRLRPEDVEVAAVLGRVNGDDRLADPVSVPMTPLGQTDGRWQYVGEFTAERAGPLGVTARVTPRHRLLSGPADLGLIAFPADPASPSDGEDGD
jgi:starch phosphorylase